jgi:hypothetical protein
MKYLFQAVFTDGHTITQTQADKSNIDPTKSAFYDVLTHSGELESFTLKSKYQANVKAVVYLKTGEILVDGVLQPYMLEAVPSDCKRELVYWRLMNANYGEAPTIAGYLIGWRATFDGEEIQINGETIQHVVTVN